MFRDKIITRGQVISEEDAQAAEEISSAFYEFVQKSTNPMLREWAKQNAPESLIALHKELGELIAQTKKTKK